MRYTLAIVVLLGAATVARADSKSKAPLEWAEALIAHIAPEDNEYDYRAPLVTWKGSNGATAFENHADCSGFMIRLLEQSYGWDADEVKKRFGTTRPLAHVFYETIAAGKGFTLVKTVKDVQPGDVIGVKYPPGVKDTGHVMLVAGVPKPIEGIEPFSPGTVQWELAVIDSSKSGHGTTDTRRKPDHTFGQGVGKGVLRLYSNDAGELRGYAWSTSAKSKFESVEEHRVAIGRLDLSFRP